MNTNKQMKKIFATGLSIVLSLPLWAQGGTNSPYSQFGLGILARQSAGFNRGMNGLAYGFHENDKVNFQNPASYSAIDSLTFIFDAGVSLQITNFEEKGHRKNARNSSIEYAVAAFRAYKHLGVSFGFLPYSNVGYNFQNTENINAFPNPSSQSATFSNTFSGSGGLHQVYLGIGWEPIRNLSIGANASYLWGELNRDVVNSYSDKNISTLSKSYITSVASYKVDLGLQYTQKINRKNQVTLGLIYSLGNKLNANPECHVISRNSQTLISDTTSYVIHKALELPQTFGGGVTWNYSNQLKLGFDYQIQKWAKIAMPQFTVINGVADYKLVGGQFNDRQLFTLGGEFTKGDRHRSFLGRMHYRAGISYATPYLKIEGQDGPREISASVGVGIPIMNNYNNRGLLNISCEWFNRQANNFIKENVFRINIGLTFNERWFAKFKVE